MFTVMLFLTAIYQKSVIEAFHGDLKGDIASLKNEKAYLFEAPKTIKLKTVNINNNEISRLLFNINMKFIEVVRLSNNANNNKQLIEVLRSGCDLKTADNLIVKGYMEKNADFLIQADICIEKLAMSLGYK